MRELVFRFRGDSSGTYEASFATGFDDTPMVEVTRVSWSEVLKSLAHVIAKMGIEGLTMFVQRTDHGMLPPAIVPRNVVELFLQDPVEAIRQWTVSAATHTFSAVPRPVQAGHPVLARMFGEWLYLPFGNGRFESPISGLVEDVAQSGFPARLRRVADDWASVNVEELLAASDADRFYFPRPWAGADGWITREELQQKLASYREEKAKVTCLPSPLEKSPRPAPRRRAS